MTQEEKQLLLTDLCARLPYRPKGVKLYGLFDPKDITIIGYTGRFVEAVDDEIEVERVRLYLRPMSSMTEKEKKEYASLIQNVHWTMVGLEARGILSIDLAECKDDDEGSIENIYKVIPLSPIDWLNKHHFDYQNLIDKGLALKAPEGMYKIENI